MLFRCVFFDCEGYEYKDFESLSDAYHYIDKNQISDCFIFRYHNSVPLSWNINLLF